ncbi:MAG: rod shape-determining protein MreD [Chloroflexota bacterium]|nr:rod shape-determining protein MreD [Chloroflexota bacterium]
MMSRVVFAVVLLVAALAQAALLPGLGPLGVLPNLVLVLLLVWCALRGSAEGLLWVFGAGVLLDLLALDPIGTNGLALLPVAALAAPARRRFFHSGMIVPLSLAMVATVAHAAVLTGLRALGDGAAPPAAAMAQTVVLQALLNALLVPPLYLVAGWMDRLTPERA